MTDNQLLEEISENLKKLLALFATQAMTEDRKLVTLKKMKFTSPEISGMTGIPEPTIRRKWNKK